MVFLDETGLMLAPLVRRTWPPRGWRPVMYCWDRHDRLSEYLVWRVPVGTDSTQRPLDVCSSLDRAGLLCGIDNLRAEEPAVHAVSRVDVSVGGAHTNQPAERNVGFGKTNKGHIVNKKVAIV